MIARIKNPYLRRVVVIVTLPFLLTAVAVVGAAEGAINAADELVIAALAAWKGAA